MRYIVYGLIDFESDGINDRTFLLFESPNQDSIVHSIAVMCSNYL